MGAGAISGMVKAAVSSASKYEIQETFAGMDDTAKVKLKEALVSLEQVSEAGGAPFLRECAEKLLKRAAEDAEDMSTMMEIAMNPEGEKAKAHKQANLEFHNVVCRPLLEKSFKRHDTKQNGVLDSEEASEFFKNAVVEMMEVTKATFKSQVMDMLAMMGLTQDMIDQMLAMPDDDDGKGKGKGKGKSKGQMKAELKKMLDAVYGSVDESLKTITDEYQGAKAERDTDAFKVLDVNADGTIQLEEFLAAFEPGSEKSLEFKKALGIDEMRVGSAAQAMQGNMMKAMTG